jgi:hypothetical protein
MKKKKNLHRSVCLLCYIIHSYVYTLNLMGNRRRYLAWIGNYDKRVSEVLWGRYVSDGGNRATL